MRFIVFAITLIAINVGMVFGHEHPFTQEDMLKASENRANECFYLKERINSELSAVNDDNEADKEIGKYESVANLSIVWLNYCVS